MGDMGVPHVQPWNTKEGRSVMATMVATRTATTRRRPIATMDITTALPAGFMPDAQPSERRRQWIARTLGMTMTPATTVTSDNGLDRNDGGGLPTPGRRRLFPHSYRHGGKRQSHVSYRNGGNGR